MSTKVPCFPDKLFNGRDLIVVSRKPISLPTTLPAFIDPFCPPDTLYLIDKSFAAEQLSLFDPDIVTEPLAPLPDWAIKRLEQATLNDLEQWGDPRHDHPTRATEPKDNSDRDWCYWCNNPTEKLLLLESEVDYCRNCDR